MDMLVRETVSPNIGPAILKQLMSKYLAKRRVVFYLCRKFDDADKTLHAHVCTMEAYRQSGLNDLASCQWLATMPEYFQEVAKFIGRLLRGQRDLEKLLDAILVSDPVATAEAHYPRWGGLSLYHSVSL